MKKILLSVCTATAILAATSFTNPLPNSVKATDNGGVLQAIDAYKDGIGAELMDKPGVATDNSAFNTLVFKYGEAAKANNVTLVDQVVYGTSPVATQAEKVLVGKLTIDGASCNDSNVNTIGETWLSGICQGGIMVNGVTCNDSNIQTINDIYTNNICAGTNVENQPCNDINIQTINDIYHNGVCAGTSVPNGTSCNDNNAATYNETWLNGICQGGVTNGTTCNDGVATTFLDVYANGVCAGITNGTTCNDNNIQTINDIYTSGICAGTNVQGQTCNDNNILTINDVYNNGICAGTNVQGTSCNDNNAVTLNDIYTNGVCAGTIPVSCNQIKTLVPTAASGNYTISPNGSQFTAYCNMTVAGGGWTLVYQSTSDNVARSLISTSDWNAGPSGDFSRLYSMRNVKNSSGKYEFYVFNNNNTFLQFTQTNSYDQNPVGNSYTKIAGDFTFNPDATNTWNGLALGNFGSSAMNLQCTLSTSYSGTTWWNCLQDQLPGQYGTGPWQIGQTNTAVYIYQR